jgi:hypothetical protein
MDVGGGALPFTKVEHFHLSGGDTHRSQNMNSGDERPITWIEQPQTARPKTAVDPSGLSLSEGRDRFEIRTPRPEVPHGKPLQRGKSMPVGYTQMSVAGLRAEFEEKSARGGKAPLGPETPIFPGATPYHSTVRVVLEPAPSQMFGHQDSAFMKTVQPIPPMRESRRDSNGTTSGEGVGFEHSGGVSTVFKDGVSGVPPTGLPHPPSAAGAATVSALAESPRAHPPHADRHAASRLTVPALNLGAINSGSNGLQSARALQSLHAATASNAVWGSAAATNGNGHVPPEDIPHGTGGATGSGGGAGVPSAWTNMPSGEASAPPPTHLGSARGRSPTPGESRRRGSSEPSNVPSADHRGVEQFDIGGQSDSAPRSGRSSAGGDSWAWHPFTTLVGSTHKPGTEPSITVTPPGGDRSVDGISLLPLGVTAPSGKPESMPSADSKSFASVGAPLSGSALSSPRPSDVSSAGVPWRLEPRLSDALILKYIQRLYEKALAAGIIRPIA